MKHAEEFGRTAVNDNKSDAAPRRRTARRNRSALGLALAAIAVLGAAVSLVLPHSAGTQALLFLLACPACAYIGTLLMEPPPPDRHP